jgi:hypothetical protein
MQCHNVIEMSQLFESRAGAGAQVFSGFIRVVPRLRLLE